MKRIKKIRVFKMIYPDKTVMFDCRYRDNGGIHIAFDHVKTLAEYVKKEADDFLKKYKESPFVALVAIDFHPFHEIERKSAPTYPYRCLPLDDVEKEEFWKYFSAP